MSGVRQAFTNNEARSLAFVCYLRDCAARADRMPDQLAALFPLGGVYLNELPAALRELAEALDHLHDRAVLWRIDYGGAPRRRTSGGGKE